jgi:hypothetical protein
MTKRLSVIVPYRDRAAHLEQFAPAIKMALESQGIDFSLLIVEQTFDKPFNRAKLLNVGFELSKEFDYFCFHDVDMLPIVFDYSYVTAPTHLAAEVEQFGWGLAYQTYFGGVTMFDKESFLKINGYSNEYHGWGAEDDDLFNRCKKMGLAIRRRTCRFSSLDHERVIDDQLYTKNVQRLHDFEETFVDGKFPEGLSTLQFEILEDRNVPFDDSTKDYRIVKVKI